MKILVLNCGSSSVKFQLIETGIQAIEQENEEVIVRGSIEKIGVPPSVFHYQPLRVNPLELSEKKESLPPTETVEINVQNHQEAVRYLLNRLTDSTHGVVSSPGEIAGVGHRVVHGGEKFHEPAEITDEVLQEIKHCCDFAPLHNPHNITGFLASRDVLPHCPHVAVFDTAFHQSIPQKAYMYALPYEMYEKHGIRRYGFHGTSHRYVSARAAKLMKQQLESLRIITCHLGNGSSITAVRNGKSVDTSMGFTPLEGVLMGTRTGDFDPSVILTLMEKERLDCQGINDLVNKKSGLLGISGISSDLRAVQEAAENGNQRAQLALEMCGYRIKKYIAAFAGVMDGADCVVFTGGIGENSAVIRQLSCSGLSYMGLSLDEKKNAQCRSREEDISSLDSIVKVWVIPTNEELVLARDTVKCLHSSVHN